MDMAVAITAASHMTAMSPSAIVAIDAIRCVPLRSARPSFSTGTIGVMPAAAIAALPGISFSSSFALPSPQRTRARCASGARSPDAPTDPLDGIIGVTFALSISAMVCATIGLVPLCPRDKLAVSRSIIPRTTSLSSGSPTPAACERIMFICK